MEPKAALAGVTVEISFAIFRTWMRPFSIETELFCPSCRWGVDAIVDARGRYKKPVWHEGWEEKNGIQLRMSGYPVS